MNIKKKKGKKKRKEKKSPTDQPPLPIKPSPQLPLRLNNLPLQDRIPHNILTILGPDSCQPDSLRSAFIILPSFHLPPLSLLPTSPLIPIKIPPPINNHIRRILMPPHMANKVHPDAPRALIVHIPVQAERPQMALQLAAEQRRGLATAGVASALRAEEDDCRVGGGAGV